MGWGSQTDFINRWIDELESLIYEFKLPSDILEKTRRLLTRAIDEGLGGSGHPGAYVALACFYLACRANAKEFHLESLLTSPLGDGLVGERLVTTVKTIQRALQLRICTKCGLRDDNSERFCSTCGKWLPYSVVSSLEEEKCMDFQ